MDPTLDYILQLCFVTGTVTFILTIMICAACLIWFMVRDLFGLTK